MNKTLENQIQTEEKKHKHKKFLLLFLLLLLFLSSVGALSFVFIRILSPNTTKIDIKTIFEDDTSHWNDDVSTITSSAFTGDGWVYNDASSPISGASTGDVLTWLKNYSDTTGDTATVVDWIDIDIITTQTNNTWIQVSIDANPYSRAYEGSFFVYFYLQNGDQGSLAIDFTNTNIDLTSENTSGYSISELFNAIKSATGNNDLDVNAIKLQVDTDPTAGTTWVDYSADAFGITSTTPAQTLLAWDISSDKYINIRLAPGGVNPTYYSSSSPITFTLKLFRNEIAWETGWKTGWNGAFYVTPDNSSLLSRFDEIYSGTNLYDGRLDGEYLETYNFDNIDGDSANFVISGNPFYDTHSSAVSDYEFSWGYVAKVNVSTLMIDGTSSPITTLGTIFYATPNIYDVIYVLKQVINPSIVNTISWNQIEINILSGSGGGDITLAGMSSSISYTTTIYTISYALID